MNTTPKTRHPTYRLILTFGYLFTIGLFVIYGSYLTIRYFTYSQTCFTTAQVQSDTRCLYILSGKVYNKGSRSKPHHGNPCGTDVTNVILSFHTQSPVKYLDPNYVGNICTNQPVPTNTPLPTQTASCAKHSVGDADCDGIIGIADYEQFRKEYTHASNTTLSDFDNDVVVSISDFEIWRREYTTHI